MIELAVSDETWSMVALAGFTGIGSMIKMYIDYRKIQAAEAREHELKMLHAKSEAALRASIVGVERHKKTMTSDSQLELAKAIRDAAIEESAEDHLLTHLDQITNTRGTQFYNPKKI